MRCGVFAAAMARQVDSYLRIPMTSRTALRMDQAVPPHQGLLRGQRERRQDTDLERHVGIRPGGNRLERAGDQILALRLSTDSESHAFRENAHFTGLRRYRLPRNGQRKLQTGDCICLLTGH